jgi:signal transduction histidine kinase
MPHALPRRIKLAFIVQALVASLVMALGFAMVAVSVRQVLVRERLADEAAETWTRLASDPSRAWPHTSRMRTYFVPAGAPVVGVPASLRSASPGTEVDLWGGTARRVDRRPEGALYLEFDPRMTENAVLWTALLSLLLAFAVTCGAAWHTYRTSKRMVVPVSWLAGVVARWDPREPDADALAPPSLPPDSGPEVRRLAHSLRGLAARVGASIARERHFTRDASHELRTPLTVIRFAADILAGDPAVPARSQRAVARIQRAGHDMQAVIDAFMILARDAEVEAEIERFDVHEVVDVEVASVRPLLEGRPVELRVTDNGGGPVDAPRRVLALIIGNLLSNAVRFTEHGRIDVTIAADQVEIRDTGVGMSEETLTKAFDAFYRHDRDREDGMGIGLSIVRRLADRYGWPVSLSSEPGVGTVAVVKLRR